MEDIIAKLDSMTNSDRLKWLKDLLSKTPFTKEDGDIFLRLLDEYNNFGYSRELYIESNGGDRKELVRVISSGIVDVRKGENGDVTFYLKNEDTLPIDYDCDLYIRFGEIPENEESSVFRGEYPYGKEKGVSVYPAIINKDGSFAIGITLPVTRTSLDTFRALMEYESRNVYVVTGKYVGKGTDNEPLIKNVKILKNITSQYRRKLYSDD